MAREGLRWRKKKGIGKRRAFERGAEAEANTVRGRGSIGAAGLIRPKTEEKQMVVCWTVDA